MHMHAPAGTSAMVAMSPRLAPSPSPSAAPPETVTLPAAPGLDAALNTDLAGAVRAASLGSPDMDACSCKASATGWSPGEGPSSYAWPQRNAVLGSCIPGMASQATIR